MADEPSNGDLAWRLEMVQRTLSDLVSRAEYTARLEAAERRFADIVAELAKTNKRLDEHEQNHREDRRSWREILWPMLGAAVASGLGYVLTQLLGSGGH